jgi:hypothetical protein
VENYLPRYLKSRRHARRVETVAASLFPGYVFVAIDMLTQRRLSIQSTIGVARLVRDGDRPARSRIFCCGRRYPNDQTASAAFRLSNADQAIPALPLSRQKDTKPNIRTGNTMNQLEGNGVTYPKVWLWASESSETLLLGAQVPFCASVT